MSLGVIPFQMLHVATAGRVRAVDFGILPRGFSKELLPRVPALKLVGVLEGVAAFMPEDLHELLSGRAFGFQHLAAFKPHQTGMGQVKRDGDARHTVRREPIIRQPEMRAEADPAIFQVCIEFLDALLKPCPLHPEIQVPEARGQQIFVGHPGAGKTPDALRLSPGPPPPARSLFAAGFARHRT